MKTACLVITLALMVMTVASTRYRRVQRTRKVYEDPKPCDQACRTTCCDGDCKHDAGLKDVCDSECGCGSRKRTLEDPNPCNQCYNECCEGDCTAGSAQEDICLSECGCRKRTLQGLMAERRRTFFEDPKPCDEACHTTCCEGDCKHDAGLKDVCDSECGCGSRKRTLEDPNPCNQQCYSGCCEGECTAGSEQEDICLSECGCRKRTLQALKAKRGDEEYPTDTEYYSVSAEECAACKKTCNFSDAVCNEICDC